MAAHRIEMCSHRELLLSGADEREHGSLGVEAKDDPEVTRYLMGAHEHLAVLLLDARRRGVNIPNVEVVKPERGG